jgi:cytochrome P450
MSDTLTTDAAQIAQFPIPRAAGCPFDPPPELRRRAAEMPLSRVRIWDGSTPWIVTGHAEQHALLADRRVSVDERMPGFPHWNEGMAATVAHRPRSVFNSDTPEHTRYRRMMTSSFTARRVEAARPAMQRLTDELIDAMLDGPRPADLVAAVALPLPTRVISEILGVPYEDHDFLQRNATIGVGRDATPEQLRESAMATGGYLARLIKSRTEDPRDDVVSDLAQRVKAGELTLAEAAQMGTGLMIAGHETTANMIGLGTLALLEHPDQLAILRDSTDPKTIADAVEELLRYLTIIHGGQRRIAKEDIEIGDVVIRAGEGIIIELASANRDPRAFPDPDRLDLSRSARQHHAFGYGIHQCIGQQLARVELQILFGTLFRRVPTLRLATTVDQIAFKHDRLAYGVYELPVDW